VTQATASVRTRLRGLFFCPKLGGGGAEMQVVRIVNELPELGVEPVVAVSRGRGEYESRLRSDVELETCQRLVRSSTLGVLASIPALRSLIRRHRPDVVCAIQEHASAALAAAVAFSERKPRLVLGIQNNFSARLETEPSWTRALLHPRYRSAYAAADWVIANSSGVADDLATQVPSTRDKLSVVYNAGLDRHVFELAREPLPEPRPSGSVIVTCGRLTQQKDQQVLLRAFARLRTSLEATLWILGQGEERPHLEALARELGVESRVRFWGFRENPYPFLSAADVFVLSSRWEGFGNVVVEALACGVPVVSTDCPHGPREILDGGRYGRLVPVGGVVELSRAIEETLASERMEEGAALLRERALVFTAEASARGYAAVFSSVTQAGTTS
jgi:glycosyltransferase involved in cell wall biosynthesis